VMCEPALSHFCMCCITGGLPVLVGFLEEDYSKSQILVFNAIDCIRHVFEINVSCCFAALCSTS
jgi:hypothetical protein